MGIVTDIKKKQELQGLLDSIVEQEIQKVLQQHPSWKASLDNPRSAGYKGVLKLVRATLRRRYGLFRRERIPETIDFREARAVHELLARHSSTKERLPFYKEMYRSIFNVTGKPATILDLGCGLNPLSLSYMRLRKINYYAYDIGKVEVDLLNKFFGQTSACRGKAEVLDITDSDRMSKLPSADVCFLFKVTDLVDRGRGHKGTEQLIDAVPCRSIVISFSTRTMSGKPMTAPRRRWMEWLCKRRGWAYEILEFENEIVYVVRK